METSGEIPLGSTAKLRKHSKLAQKAELNSIKQLANSTRHIFDLDAMLPQSSIQPPRARLSDDLSKLPVLIATADEERKQLLVSSLLFKC